MINPLDLTDRVVAVTGASSGIGLAVAVLLSKLGARVVLIGRNIGRLSAASGQLEGIGHRTEEIDLSDLDSLTVAIRRISLEMGPLSGLVHCAGTQLTRPLRMLNSAEINSLMHVNVNAALMLAKAYRQKGVHTEPGSIVFMSSVMGLVGVPGNALYCASKGALSSMARALALELAGEGIRVNAIAPGYVRTPMLQALEDSIGTEKLLEIERMHPLGLGEATDVAHAVAFLLADTSRWITGTTLVVDGGYTAR